MSPGEFRAWLKVWGECPVDADGDAPFADAAWETMQAKINRLDDAPGLEWPEAIAWAAFWLAVGAVGVALVTRF